MIPACSVSVNYATSDGTAVNGTDYLSTNGTLNLPAGAEQASFSFFIQKFNGRSRVTRR